MLAAQAAVGNRAAQRVFAAPSSRDIVARAITKPDAKVFSFERTHMKSLEKAVRKGNAAKADTEAQALHGANPTYFKNLLRYKLNKHAGNATKRQAYLSLSPCIPVLKQAMTAEDAVLVKQLMSFIGWIPKADLLAVATQSPDFFLESILKPLQTDPLLQRYFREVMLDKYFDPSQKQLGGLTKQATDAEDLRSILRTKLGKKWVDFAKTIPVLAPAEEAAEHFATQEEAPDPEEIVDRIFESYVTNRGINIGYYTVSKDSTENIMMGPAGGAVTADLGEVPPVLRTQCDDIMKILREAVRAYPGLDVKFTIGMEKQALLTKPLDTLPGGLIPKDGQGNVQDSNGAWTKQIFFTGVQDTKEPNSHTWLVINGKPYDAVLGTKGPEVAASAEGSFTQSKEQGTDGKDSWQTVWTDSAGNKLTRLEGVTAPANPMGFGSAYRLEKA